MYEYLVQHPIVAIAFLVVVIACVIFLAIKKMQTVGMEKVRGYVYKLFVRAEHEFEHGDNTDKFEYVVLLAKRAIPAPFNLVITEALLRKVVQTWFDLCKDLLDDGKMNGSKAEEE